MMKLSGSTWDQHMGRAVILVWPGMSSPLAAAKQYLIGIIMTFEQNETPHAITKLLQPKAGIRVQEFNRLFL